MILKRHSICMGGDQDYVYWIQLLEGQLINLMQILRELLSLIVKTHSAYTFHKRSSMTAQYFIDILFYSVKYCAFLCNYSLNRSESLKKESGT